MPPRFVAEFPLLLLAVRYRARLCRDLPRSGLAASYVAAASAFFLFLLESVLHRRARCTAVFAKFLFGQRVDQFHGMNRSRRLGLNSFRLSLWSRFADD